MNSFTWFAGLALLAQISGCSSQEAASQPNDDGTGGESTSSSGGNAASGGAAASGGTASGGTASGGSAGSGEGGAGGAGGAADARSEANALCGEGMTAVGEYATWCGKVNVYTTEEWTWQTDALCNDGCNSDTVAYCEQIWPEATTQVQRDEPTPEHKTFYDAGCTVGHSHAGFDQYVCCVPVQ